MSTMHDELDRRLSSLFDMQARALPTPRREVRSAEVVDLASARRRRRTRRFVAGGIALITASAAAALAAVTLDGSGSDRIRTEEPVMEDPSIEVGPLLADSTEVTLSTEALWLEAGGERYSGAAPLDVHTSGDFFDEAETLEFTWDERGVEMRLNFYFETDGTDWWASHVQHYPGRGEGEWLTYPGPLFRSPLGTAYEGDVDLTTQYEAPGRLHIAGLRLEPFRRPEGCTKPGDPFFLHPDTPQIEMFVTDHGGYSAHVTPIDAASCTPITDRELRYEWTVADPEIARVAATGPNGDIAFDAVGQTTLNVIARDAETGEFVADTVIRVNSLPAP